MPVRNLSIGHLSFKHLCINFVFGDITFKFVKVKQF